MKADQEDVKQYADIINLPRHISDHRNHMPIKDRAAQFSPFAAVVGYDAAIKEAARQTDQKIELTEAEITLLDDRLRLIEDQLSHKHVIEIVFFQPDDLKSGGAYRSKVGSVKSIDGYERQVTMMDGVIIPVEEILEIKGKMFFGWQ